MRKGWTLAAEPLVVMPGRVQVRVLRAADEAALGGLMWLAFRGGMDDEYGGPADAQADASGALAGRWGPVVWHASLAAEVESALVSAVVIVLDDAHDGLPLLAFAVTDPVFQRRGIGRGLIEESIRRLDAAGVKELHLAVTRGNPAFALYQRLGFEVVPGQNGPGGP
jgi:GNAT superfamily N-acetyltransferase